MCGDCFREYVCEIKVLFEFEVRFGDWYFYLLYNMSSWY